VEKLTIGKLAKKAGVNIETVRYYERRGLMQKPPRRESGYREYPLEAVKRIKFVRRAKELGFSLKEIMELLLLRVDPNTSSSEVKKRAATKIDDIEEKIGTLQRMKETLTRLVNRCDGCRPTSECPILEALK